MMRSAYFAVFCLVSVSAVNYNMVEEGYPEGLLSDCPGSWKPAIVKPKSLERLFVSVITPGKILTTKWTPYNYYHIGDLAKHPDIDFKTRKTILYIDGYLQTTSMPFGRAICKAYRDIGYNVLLLDTLEFTTKYYPIAARIMRPIGKHVAEMLVNLTAHGLDPKKLELVGISLGVHTMSFIAKNYRQMTGRNISSLTALDPAGPCFRHLGPDQRIDASDADFVLNMVTNADGLGMGMPVGHVNFYVNGGEFQPHDIWFIPCSVECSHMKAYFYWAAAVMYPGTFIGMQCDSVQQARSSDCYKKEMVTNTMDVFTDKTKPGIYFVATANRYPYSLGKRGLRRPTFTIEHLAGLNDPDLIEV